MNPSNHPVTDLVKIYVDYWEASSLKKKGFEVIDEANNMPLPYQIRQDSRGIEVYVLIRLAPGEQKRLSIRIGAEHMLQGATASSFQRTGTDGMTDIKEPPAGVGNVTSDPISITETSVETPFIKIVWKEKEGVVSVFDKKEKRELVRTDWQYAAFTPIYEVTPAGSADNMMQVRKNMGRNRKGLNVKRTAGNLVGVKGVEQGDHFATVELLYELTGTSYCSLFLTAYAGMPRIDVAVRMHKDSVWDPENVFVSLPFEIRTDAEPAQLWLQKYGFLLRPGKDQLPGSLIDFYTIEEGVAYSSGQYGLAIAMPDTPLVQLGSLEFGERLLNGQQEADLAHAHLYSWVMTNYWETNFKATMGGFYEFNYRLSWGSELASEEAGLQRCRDMNDGLVCFRLKE
ncbi:glycoside hydrolase family 38 C-terminal domain-containing protein [Paenibacillus periandrae]|uniref:glycoside hydrolase family 38 C-terminal domain-containing protein n=1 Tax=Paenibacillus periandrae TaxID=1761741 RepID=UPI001F09241C|nr:glycoside hydrolase family 38 C-terminal domain-containing protein [Paenibacillus periandrae]